MKKANPLIVITALFFTAQTCVDNTGNMYDRSFARWNSGQPRSYYIKVNYRLFSPMQGEWELEVREGRVVSASFGGVWDDKYLETAKRFTVDSIYSTAEAVKSGDTDGPMLVRAEFIESAPYIRSVSRIANVKFQGGVIKDAGFSIVILEFIRR